jgi:16S rRNA processing protein RimM
MGRLLKPRGLKGKLQLTIFNEVDSVLKIGMEIWVELAERVQYSHLIESLNIAGVKSWIKFSGYNKREDVDNLSGMIFSIPRSAFTPLKDKEFYLVDMIDCKVLDEKRKVIGIVVDTISLPEQNLLVMETMGIHKRNKYFTSHSFHY